MKVGRSIGRGAGLALAVAVLLAVLLPGIASAATPWTEQRLTTEHWYNTSASVVDPQGRVHIATRRSGAGAGVRYLRPEGDGWVETVVAPDSGAGLVAIALDPGGRPVIAWVHGVRQIRIASRADGGWNVDRVRVGNVVGERLAFAVDADGHRHLAWFQDGDSRLHYATDRGGRWWRYRVGPVDTYGSPAMAVAADGVAWLAAPMERNDCCSQTRIRAIRIDGHRVTNRRLGDGFDPFVMLDDQERPVVAWTGSGMRFRTLVDGRWARATVLHRTAFPIYGVDIKGERLAVAYDRWKGGVNVSQRTGTDPWNTVSLPHWWACVPTALHVIRAATLLLPCQGWGADPTFMRPGIGLRKLTPAGSSIRSVVAEERYPEVFTAQGPDGRLEVLATASDGRLILHRQMSKGWAKVPLPRVDPLYVTAFTIGPDGDHAIVGHLPGFRLMLFSDRGGTWQQTPLGRGTFPQVSIDREGRYHVGYIRREGWRRTLWVAVGTPGDWRRSRIPGSTIYRDQSNPVFMVEPDGSDAVVWKRKGDIDRNHGGIRLARSSGAGWSVQRLGDSGFTELWSAAMAPDGSIGIVRGGLMSNRLQTIRGDRRTIEELPGVTFFGGTVVFDRASRPAILAVGWNLDRLVMLRRLSDGWRRTTVTEDTWDDARIAPTGDGPAVIIGWHPRWGKDAGWWVMTRPD